MKKIITLVFLAVILCLSARSQSHLTFLGIPIDGDAYSFCESIYTIDKIPTKKRDFSEILFNVYEKGFSFGFLNRLLPSSWFSPIGEIDLIFSRDSVDEYSILITFNDMANSETVAASCPPVELK